MDKAKAKQVLDRIDEILRWERRVDQQKDQKFAELGKYLCEVRNQRYWGAWGGLGAPLLTTANTMV